VRSESALASLLALGVDAHAHPMLDRSAVASLLERAGAEVDAVITFPPDGRTDADIAPALGAARRIAYVSSTGVYGEARGAIDESTPVDATVPRSRARLEAETVYRERGAIVLRAAGIYGPGRGLHRRILEGTFRMPADGGNVVSRIHVEDLSTFILAALERGTPGTTFVLADDTPVPQREAIAWLCQRLGRAEPASLPLGEVAETLRHDRSVDNAAAKRSLGVQVAFPSYREGFEACLLAEGDRIDRSIDPAPKVG
jgi:nucleoside-diphosphate-sugar epimerase